MMDVNMVKEQKFKLNRIALLIAFFSALALGPSTLLLVDQRQYAVVVSGLGSLKRVISAPGLYWKLPLPFDRFTLLDKRTQTVTAQNPEHYLTADKKQVLVRLYIQWRITDPDKYFSHFRHELAPAQNQLLQLAHTALNAEVGQHSLAELVANHDNRIMHAMQTRITRETSLLGLEIADISMTHLDFPAELNDAIYKQMGVERAEAAHQLRSAGMVEAAEERSYAERQCETILAQGYKQAQRVKGNGDAQAMAIYASAFGRDPQFYRFYKSLDAYRQTFREREVIVVDPSSDFFRFMHNSAGTPSSKR